MSWLRRFHARAVVWRQILNWAVLNIPLWIEPVFIATWALLFLLGGAARRGIMSNLKSIKPGSSAVMNLPRAYRVLWNFAWTLSENGRFRTAKSVPDWEFVGIEHFQRLCNLRGGAIILTAHMGSYDLGAHVFSEMCDRRIVMVRAPEVDPETHAYEEQTRAADGSVKIDFNTKAEELAFELLRSIQGGEIVAIQGDRATPGIATIPARMFGKEIEIPAGPFALAMAARVPIFPLFVVRRGRRRYRLVTLEPMIVERKSRERDQDIRRAVQQWSTSLENVIRDSWHQWFALEPFAKDAA